MAELLPCKLQTPVRFRYRAPTTKEQMSNPLHRSDTEADEAHDTNAPAVQNGVDARLSNERSRVRVPIGAPSEFVRSIALESEKIPEYTMHIADTIPPLTKTQRKWVEEVAAAAR